jgi:hypothetical protein
VLKQRQKTKNGSLIKKATTFNQLSVISYQLSVLTAYGVVVLTPTPMPTARLTTNGALGGELRPKDLTDNCGWYCSLLKGG